MLKLFRLPMLLPILLGLLVLVAMVLFVASLRPDSFRVSRSITIAAPAARIFPEVNDLHRYQQWNPWAHQDPAMTAHYQGPAAGVGAHYAWSSRKVGTGAMTILESRSPELVRMRLDFLKPFKATNTADFTFTPAPEGTVVTWSMYGPQGLPGKAMGLVVNLDRMIGGEFEKGLADLKRRMESPATAGR